MLIAYCYCACIMANCADEKAMQYNYTADPDCLDGFLHIDAQNSADTITDTDNAKYYIAQWPTHNRPRRRGDGDPVERGAYA